MVYSNAKEIDFGTNLINGPYAGSKLGEAFREANKMTQTGKTYLSDFAPYLPSYNQYSGFISTPIFDGDKKIGILIAQISNEALNNLLSKLRSLGRYSL